MRNWNCVFGVEEVNHNIWLMRLSASYPWIIRKWEMVTTLPTGGLLSVFAVKKLCNEHFKSSRKQKCSHVIDSHAINKQKFVDFFQRDRHRMFAQTWIRPIFVHHCIERGLKDEIFCLLSIRTSQSQRQHCGRTQRAIWRALDYCTQTYLSCWIQMVAVCVCVFFFSVSGWQWIWRFFACVISPDLHSFV